MSYRERTRRRSNPAFRIKKVHKTEVLGHAFKKDVETTECSHVPSEIEENNVNSIGGKIDNGVIGIGGTYEKQKKLKTKFKPKGADYG